MENISPQWRRLLKNAGWYVATLIILMLSLRFLRGYGLFLLWGVGLGWGAILAYQFSRLAFHPVASPGDGAELQSYLDQAAAYRQKIDQVVAGAATQAERLRLEQLAAQIETWTATVAKLVERLINLRQDELIQRDLRQVPQAITELEKKLAAETDPALKLQLERTLANRRKQLDALTQLQNSMVQAEMQIESTVSMLGTIYSQILTGQSTSDVADYQDISTEVDEEVRVLQDHLEALREVKLGGESAL